jgi:SpoVK/Ycf46/Vps4 family AAA+-type ATPase
MMETDYLLQRIEGYTGAVILATNLRQQIDEAFLRRIQVVVEFPFPDTELRAQIWTNALQRRNPGLTTDEMEHLFSIRQLAERFSFTGATIEGICENAELLVLAASLDTPENWPSMLECAIQRELRKQGKPYGP